ncbi:polysaccharide deacetylase family protein [Halieaceae bacterium IMCC14734]|uniref:Polysaccharide deacetylase family protein n=2 Tax=Candidatus Litorirhabdus singularis TaxID=2518993 RepID=A0ABT3TG81_9GAMM|nr:polysaccharide deacetylase family protein [Candidatus Litorirhabdus singularis]
MASGVNGAKLQILIYHRVLPCKDPLQPSEPDTQEFAWQMDILARYFNVLPLEEALLALQNDDLPPRAAAITFDDGYADNLHLALPILEAKGVHATIFVAPGYLDGGIMFNDRVQESLRDYNGSALDLSELGLAEPLSLHDAQSRRAAINTVINAIKYLPPAARTEAASKIVELTGAAIPEDLMLSTAELKTLGTANVTIGAHTMNHPILATLDEHAAKAEIYDSKKRLEEILQKPVSLFAYPNGMPGKDYTQTQVEIVKSAGFSAAVSTSTGYSSRNSNMFELNRFTPWDKTPGKFLLRLLKNYI